MLLQRNDLMVMLMLMWIHDTEEEKPGYIEEDGLEVEGEADPLVILVVPDC